VDAQHGAATLDRHPEARRQAALADRLLLTKTDVAADTDRLSARLAALNPGAPLLRAIAGDVAPSALFSTADVRTNAAEADARLIRIASLADTPGLSPSQRSPFLSAAHTDGIVTFSLTRDTALPALALTLWLEALVEHCGERLLRVKGFVDVAEMPGRPALIHGVRHVFAAPEWLDRWPSDDRRTRIVFIGEAIPRHFPVRLLSAIEAEVIDETRRQTWN
jgi:G3E family GTPase